MVFSAIDIATGLAMANLLWVIVLYVQSRKRPATRLPPGPKPLPIVGNLLDLPKGFEAAHWAKHHSKYGPISSVHALGQTLIIVNDARIAIDLLDKRSNIYSERPQFNFAGDMCGYGSLVTLMQTGDEFRSARRKMHSYVGGRSVEQLANVEWKHTLRFLFNLLDTPESLLEHIRRTAGGIILEISYGYRIESEKSDLLIEVVKKSVDAFSTVASGPWMVDLIPSRVYILSMPYIRLTMIIIVRYLPDWFPGTSFKQTAKLARGLVHDAVEIPYEFVRNERREGVAAQSFTAQAIDDGFKDDDDERTLKWTIAAIFGGGADTTVSAIATFFLAMALHPEVVKRAQEEIDSVLGDCSMPQLEDRRRLPYTNAVVLESHRWENVAPTGVPHVVQRDDNYEGYDIPKGAWIIPNVWEMLHDPLNYHDPFEFKPERFLGSNGLATERDPRTLAFGFGRRMCPGKELADQSVFLSVAMTLAMFDISKVKDENGNVIEPLHEYCAGVISHPKPFMCAITPRSERHADLIRTLESTFPREESDSKKLARLFDNA